MAALVSRIGVVEHITHQNVPDQPSLVVHRFSRQLATSEQPYERVVMVTEEWKPLDTGWLENCSLLHISNEEGMFLQTIPTPEERSEVESKVVEMAYSPAEAERGQVWIIRPRESFRGCPTQIKSLMIRCRRGKAKCNLFISPV